MSFEVDSPADSVFETKNSVEIRRAIIIEETHFWISCTI